MFPNFLSSLFPRLCPGDALLRSSPLTTLLTSPCMSFLHVQWAVLQGWGIPFSLYTLTSGTTMTGSVICLELYWGHLVCCFWFCGKWFESLLTNTRVPELRVRQGSLRERKWKRKHILETSSQEITRGGVIHHQNGSLLAKHKLLGTVWAGYYFHAWPTLPLLLWPWRELLDSYKRIKLLQDGSTVPSLKVALSEDNLCSHTAPVFWHV